MITRKSSRLVSEYPPLSPHYGSLKPKVGPGSKDVSKVLCFYFVLASLPAFIGCHCGKVYHVLVSVFSWKLHWLSVRTRTGGEQSFRKGQLQIEGNYFVWP